MKPPVAGPSGPPSAAPTRRPGGRGKVAPSFTLPDAAAPPPAEPVAIVGGGFCIAALVALTATAGTEAAGDGRRRDAHRHGEALLDSLDQLRTDILLGRIPADRLARLLALLGQRQGASGDEPLDRLIEAIELRAQVELAKLTARR